MDTLNPLAGKLQAVNTIVIGEDRKLTGHNTDAPGFLAHLQELNVDLKDKHVAILGAGGSARAILATLCMIPEQRPASIRIYNRTAQRINDLMDSLKEGFDLSLVQLAPSVEDLELRSADILINTTSIGLKEDDPLLVDPSELHSDLFVYDLIYNPEESLLLREAKDQGAKTSNGLGMLFYQAVLAFQHWGQIEIPEDIKLKYERST